METKKRQAPSIRLPEDLKAELTELAKSEERTLQNYCVYKLRQIVSKEKRK